MATVSADHHGIGPQALTAATVYTVTFTDNVSDVDITTDGTAEVYATLDGTTPAVPAAGASTACFRLPVASTTTTRTFAMPTRSDVVKLISAGTPTISVQRRGRTG